MEQTKINSKIVADSVCPRGHRLVSYIITFPRYILAELNTHRMLSKNSASSRAIPFNKMINSVMTNPFIPVAWMKEHSGMQGSQYYENQEDIDIITKIWLKGRSDAVSTCLALADKAQDERLCVTKQIANRTLEAYMWHTVLISGTEWENFFALRCPQYVFINTDDKGNDTETLYFRSRKDYQKRLGKRGYDDLTWRKLNKGMADIHMMDLAEAMWDAYNESVPKQLKEGDWHIPFGDDIDFNELLVACKNLGQVVGTGYPDEDVDECLKQTIDNAIIKVSTTRCARTSYTVVGEEKNHTLEADIILHDKFLKQRPLHASPFEHCAKVMSEEEYYSHVHTTKVDGFTITELEEQRFHVDTVLSADDFGWCKNYRGFIQYRALVPNENVEQSKYQFND